MVRTLHMRVDRQWRAGRGVAGGAACVRHGQVHDGRRRGHLHVHGLRGRVLQARPRRPQGVRGQEHDVRPGPVLHTGLGHGARRGRHHVHAVRTRQASALQTCNRARAVCGVFVAVQPFCTHTRIHATWGVRAAWCPPSPRACATDGACVQTEAHAWCAAFATRLFYSWGVRADGGAHVAALVTHLLYGWGVRADGGVCR